uniref:Uncharacterized protein n=1 Tax=Rhizophora mucronata TaxID=61149 RepID=A0A2P2R2N0_RHIMU
MNDVICRMCIRLGMAITNKEHKRLANYHL